ncbi:guanosine-3',5'-bis(diphosphate) 3'-pyrophosphohydrolase MESH1 [Hydra vulgaris]|uniref:Guanosine-3',5'-bis(diphosphate) 3'-pyrophosphohydrolase MESH1 n=1 Tax=Hydra vulgaris TaxID=6087 RepID=T2M9I0_HYDVU|nr:guanosine-3',5'-bis(diphosphate) 3'-pyrophosphohydrolase MESH1 [Hydra vulgaris]
MENKNDIKKLVEAFDFAAKKHSKQTRKNIDKTPYINHPIGVASIISSEAGITDVDILISAVLHDTVEDTNTTFEELEINFGKKIRGIVEECSDDKTLEKDVRKQMQIEKAPFSSYEAKVVKLADKLYNLRDLLINTPVGWSEGRVNEYFIWALQVVRGLKGTNSVLETELESIFRNQGIL